MLQLEVVNKVNTINPAKLGLKEVRMILGLLQDHIKA